MKVKLTIPGKPVQASRPRVTRWGAYTPESYNTYKKDVRQLMKGQFKNIVFEKGIPLQINLSFYRPIQKTGSKQLKLNKVNRDVLPTVTPDLDNYIKSILDGLNGIVWDDDRQITSIVANKYYGEKPRVEVEIKEITNDK